MAHPKLNLTTFVKNTIYVKVPNVQGIYTIWDWCSKTNRYKQRTEGVKYYVYKKVNGVQKTKCFETYQQAKTWKESSEMFLGEIIGEDVRFKEVKQKFFEKRKSTLRISTLETYESNAKHLAFFDELTLNQITPRAIDHWLSELKNPKHLALQHKSRLTYHHEISVLKQILEYYSEYMCEGAYPVPIKKRHYADAIVDKAKYDLTRAKGKRKFLPRADIERFLHGLESRAQQKPMYFLFWLTALFQIRSGTRIGETCAVDFHDIDFETGEVMISKTVLWSRKKNRPTFISPLTKTGEPRVIYLADQVLNALREWRLASGRSTGLVFSVDGFQPIAYRSVQHHYDVVLIGMGSEWRSTHILRHSFSTDYLEKTGDKQGLQGQLGHKSSKMTDHYAKITNTVKRDGMRAYSQTIEDKGSNVIAIASKLAARSG